ncbi:MAG TPA: hypothetical protein VGA30_00855, partial [Actinomycetota bacterium]
MSMFMNSMVKGLFAGAARHEALNAVFSAITETTVPCGEQDAADAFAPGAGVDDGVETPAGTELGATPTTLATEAGGAKGST